MFSKRFADQIRHASMGRQYAKPDEAEVTWVTPLDVERGAHAATERCLDAMSALASLHRYATEYAVASQTAFETALEAEDGVVSRVDAKADAGQAAKAKEAYEKALARFNGAIGCLTPEG